jgi:hypothetical protein
MMRGLAARLVIWWILAMGWQGILASTLLASEPARGGVLTNEERAALIEYAKATWHSFEELTWPNGLPADGLAQQGGRWSRRLAHTSPTNIGAYLWSVIAAERLSLIDAEQARTRIDQTLKALECVERRHGFFPNEVDPRFGTMQKFYPNDSRPRRLRISAVDNAWLAVALIMVANTEPASRKRADALLEPMDFRFFYDPYNPADPLDHPGQFHVGYWLEKQQFYGHYGMLNTEARILSYLGMTLDQLPPDLYYRMFRTLPENLAPQSQSPRGETRDYSGVKVFEGSYDYHGVRIVPSWGGSMFEALMVPLFVPEEIWAPRSWGVNHRLYTEAQIEHGLEEAHYGFWGFSPAAAPHGGYGVFGVKALGTSSQGYYSYEIDPAPMPLSPSASEPVTHGVIAPYASFLALRYAPHEALANLRAVSEKFPMAYGSMGFQDSIDVTAGVVSPCVLTLDQGMIMAAIANELADDAMRHAFSDGRIEQNVRSVIAVEEFAAGEPAENLAARPMDHEPPARELGGK